MKKYRKKPVEAIKFKELREGQRLEEGDVMLWHVHYYRPKKIEKFMVGLKYNSIHMPPVQRMIK